jgi:hypothetical protein
MPGAASALAPDHSLTPERYFALGMPAVDRLWQGDDLAKAYLVIAKLADDDPLALPRRASSVSGAVFARIIASENHEMVANAGIPVQVRVQLAAGEIGPLGQISNAYLKAQMARKGSFVPELVDMICASFSATRVVSTLLSQVEPPPVGTAGRTEFDKGRGQVERGLATQVKGLFMVLSDRTSALEADRVRLAACLARELPKAMSGLSLLSREEAKRQVGDALSTESSEAVKAELTRLREEVGAPLAPDRRTTPPAPGR